MIKAKAIMQIVVISIIKSIHNTDFHHTFVTLSGLNISTEDVLDVQCNRYYASTNKKNTPSLTENYGTL